MMVLKVRREILYSINSDSIELITEECRLPGLSIDVRIGDSTLS